MIRGDHSVASAVQSRHPALVGHSQSCLYGTLDFTILVKFEVLPLQGIPFSSRHWLGSPRAGQCSVAN
ncbi:hypothetical protein FOZ61_001774 [Perkinsus olseni]|uniref:Uncharacterized protein n=1 Tax=Perkinsus olseni TaxID=32597 RepID=A0A7J6LWV7_PEROL|nr:hypothetical protein FOZ61_001774 [Perkinsus olseni]